MKNLFLFDVDGTIADSSQKIIDEMAIVLNGLKKENVEIGIVGGGKLDKILDQMDNKVVFNHYFSECGTIYHYNCSNIKNEIELKEIYKKNIRYHHTYIKINILVKHCLNFLSNVDYILSGHFVDLRSGIIYISLIGLTATLEERAYFMNLNKLNNYRSKLIQSLKNLSINLKISNKVDIVEGGSVGIAIYQSEYDKIQVLDCFSELEYDKIYYFGDKYELNGNDYKLLNDKRVIGVKVDNFQDTIKYIVSNF